MKNHSETEMKSALMSSLGNYTWLNKNFPETKDLSIKQRSKQKSRGQTLGNGREHWRTVGQAEYGKHCKPSSWELEAEVDKAQDMPWLQRKFKHSMSYMWPCPKTK